MESTCYEIAVLALYVELGFMGVVVDCLIRFFIKCIIVTDILLIFEGEVCDTGLEIWCG